MKRILFTALFGICFSVAIAQDGTKVPYGYNESVGQYFEVATDTKLYYEIYGEGEPILMLHGGGYGYIYEF